MHCNSLIASAIIFAFTAGSIGGAWAQTNELPQTYEPPPSSQYKKMPGGNPMEIYLREDRKARLRQKNRAAPLAKRQAPDAGVQGQYYHQDYNPVEQYGMPQRNFADYGSSYQPTVPRPPYPPPQQGQHTNYQPPRVQYSSSRLYVGPGDYPSLGTALTYARPGNVIILSPGVYNECANIAIPGITLKAERKGKAIFKGNICAGKAILIITAPNVTIDGLTFEDAHAEDHNGSGIRVEASNLTIRNSQFIHNEGGILTSADMRGFLVVEQSTFDSNGKCKPACAHALYVSGKADRVIIRKSRFINTHRGHHIKSRARYTEVTGSDFSDGDKGNSSYAIDISDGGTIIIRNNRFIKGPGTDNRRSVIAIGAEGDNMSRGIWIEDNIAINKMWMPTIFVRNFSTQPMILRNNELEGLIFEKTHCPRLLWKMPLC